MNITEMLHTVQFLVDREGNKKSVMLDYQLWEKLTDLLEDMEDADEIQDIRESGEETISWEQAKIELSARLPPACRRVSDSL